MRYIIITGLIAIALIGCTGKTEVPKPRGYFRIDLPEKEYQLYDTTCPYRFEIPVYATVSNNIDGTTEPCWINIEFPQNKAKLYISYKRIDHNLPQLLDDTHDLAFKHSIKADAIYETSWTNDAEKVYSIVYDLKGNTASSLQFFATDSTTHFLRGSLYFMAQPNADSLAPVLSYLREDIIHLLETLRWN